MQSLWLLVICVANIWHAAITMENPPNGAHTNYGTCHTPEPLNEAGVCVRIEQCQYLHDLLTKAQDRKNATDRAYLRQSQCGLDNTQSDWTKRILVCCAEQNKQTVFDVRHIEPGNVLPNNGVCGLDLTDRILGGEVAGLDQFPWMVLLAYKKPSNQFGFHCGGTLINSRYVLTAGHCLSYPDMPVTWSLHSVRLGEWDTTTNPDCNVDRTGRKVCAPSHIDILIEDRIVHEDYMPNSIDQINDIALLRLANTVAYTNFVQPICLPVAKEIRNNMYENTVMDVAGWGITETDKQSTKKLRIEINVTNLTYCQGKYQPWQVRINERQLCAGGEEGIDTCRGDSGGPLMVAEAVNKHYTYFIAGIVSYGPKPCGSRGWPGVYTRVGAYIDWIQSHLKA